MLHQLPWAPSSYAKLIFAQAVFFLLAYVLPTTAIAQQPAQQIRWIDDFDTAVRYASSNQLPLLLHFYGDNCPPCKMLEKRAFQDPTLINKMNGHLVAARINGEKQKELRLRYNVTRWPTDIYLLPTGEEIYRTVSPQDPSVYGQMIDRVALRHRDWKAGAIADEKSAERRIANRTTTESAHARPAGQSMSGIGFVTHPISTSGALAAKVQAHAEANNATTTPSPLPTSLAPNQGPTVGAMSAQQTVTNPFVVSEPIQVPAASSPSVPAYSPSEITTQIPSSSNSVVATPIANQRPWNPNVVGSTNNRATPAGLSSPDALDNPSAKQIVQCETVGLDGYCPVSLSMGVQVRSNNSWVEGSPKFAVKHRGRVYYCASEGSREAFLATPDQYAPYLSCFDMIHYVKTGEYVDGKCEYGCFQAGKSRVFLFSSQENCDEFKRLEAHYSGMVEGGAKERVANQPTNNQVR